MHRFLQQEGESSAEELWEAIAVITALYVLKEYVAPPVIHWWQNNALPTMKEKWKIFTDKRKDKASQKGNENLNYIPMKLLLLMRLF